MTKQSKTNGKENTDANVDAVRDLLNKIKDMDVGELKDTVRTLAAEAGIDVEAIERKHERKQREKGKRTPSLKDGDKADFLSMFQVASEDLTQNHKDLLATMIMMDTYDDMTICRIFTTVAKQRNKVEEYAMNLLQLGADGDIGVGIFQTCEHGSARAMTAGEGMDDFIEDMLSGKVKIEKVQDYDSAN